MSRSHFLFPSGTKNRTVLSLWRQMAVRDFSSMWSRWLWEMATTSIGGRSSALHGGGYDRMGPTCWLGEHRIENMGSKRQRTGWLPCCKGGSWTRTLAWPSHVALALLPLGNEKSGSSMRNSCAAFAPVEFGSFRSPKRGRLLGSGFWGAGLSMRCDVASSMQPSSSSPHWRLSHISAGVGLCHDGQGFRKPAILPFASDGRVRSGEGAHDGRYEAQPEEACAVLAATTWCSGGSMADSTFATALRVSIVN